MQRETYNIEDYWDKVAQKISIRPDGKVIAGDDEPYYRYKRQKFLKLFDTIIFNEKKVLEIGSGPGGNLQFLLKKNCKELVGVDISEKMIELSRQILHGQNVQVFKINGTILPFEDGHFDIVFTSTVLQHNTDEAQLRKLVKEICRVADSEVILFERIEKKITGHDTNIGRPVKYYEALLKESNFSLSQTKFLSIQASYFTCGIIRKIFNRKTRKEGEPLSKTSLVLEKLFLPVTELFDQILPSKRDLAMLYFRKD
jgi:ubiquinone/menaquinone biosynthesis C-methylase UbiE